MITVRTEDNLMIYKVSNLHEKALRSMIANGDIPAQTAPLKPTSEHSKCFIITEDWAWDLDGVKLFLWKGTKILLT